MRQQLWQSMQIEAASGSQLEGVEGEFSVALAIADENSRGRPLLCVAKAVTDGGTEGSAEGRDSRVT